jgi:chromosome segregation ATPase
MRPPAPGFISGGSIIMATLTLDQIVERVNELKQESAEKDEAIRDQQVQIEELEKKNSELEGLCQELENEKSQLRENAHAADNLMAQLSSVLD